MTILLKKGQRLDDVLSKTNEKSAAKRLDAMKYVGVLKIEGDPLEIQKECVMRGNKA